MINEWALTIRKVDNGYILEGNPDDGDNIFYIVIEEDEKDELKANEELLWEIMNYFGFSGSKHDAQRLRIVRESKDE